MLIPVILIVRILVSGESRTVDGLYATRESLFAAADAAASR